MSFISFKDSYRDFNFQGFLDSVDRRKVESILCKDSLAELDFIALLSDAASQYIEPMAQKAFELTRRHFGNVVFLFTPMYLSNFCDNCCKYCSFARHNPISRKQLSMEEVRREAEKISDTGIRHILLLTGESRRNATIDYLKESIGIIKKYFPSIGIEVYPLTQSEYGLLISLGIDSLTIYQEVYDQNIYHRLHEGGPKEDYEFRLEAPDRACRQNIHAVTIGALFGLNDFRIESFFTALHLKYLQDTFPAIEFAVSLPRIRPFVNGYRIEHPVNDREFVRLLLAFRLFAPTVGITISTREKPQLRDAIVPLGVTKMSGGVSTAVGGHSEESSTTQFEIADTRTVDEIKTSLLRLGYQPVMHDWNYQLQAGCNE